MPDALRSIETHNQTLVRDCAPKVDEFNEVGRACIPDTNNGAHNFGCVVVKARGNATRIHHDQKHITTVVGNPRAWDAQS
jgi:hypothetical protein